LGSTTGAMRREASEARRRTQPSVEAHPESVDEPFPSVVRPTDLSPSDLGPTDLGPTDLDRFLPKRPSFGKRAARGLVRFAIIFGVGVAATLSWQSYGEATREAIADSYPQLGWLAPQAAALAQTDSDVAPTALATPSADAQQFQAGAPGLTAMRQSVDQLTAQLAAGQERLAGDIAKLQAAQQEILDKIPVPRPAAAMPRKPGPVALQPPQATPMR
jgi:hypothetical protein